MRKQQQSPTNKFNIKVEKPKTQRAKTPTSIARKCVNNQKQTFTISCEKPQKSKQQIVTSFSVSDLSGMSIRIERPKKNEQDRVSLQMKDDDSTGNATQPNTESTGEVVEQETKPNPTENEVPIKDVYSVEDIMQLKPKSTQKVEKLDSPGFIIYMSLSNQHNNKRKRNKQRGKTQNEKQIKKLVEHDENRFVGTAYAKDGGLFEEGSLKAKKCKAQSWLNRMNPKNSTAIIDNIYNLLNNSWDTVVDLFLESATINIEFPELSENLGILIEKTTHICNKNKSFQDVLIKKTFETAYNLISLKGVPIGCKQTLVTWISCLFCTGIFSEERVCKFFQEIINKQTKDDAIELLRTGLIVAGKYFDVNSFKAGEQFFNFLKENISSKGHVKFLVSELFAMRENKWKDQYVSNNGALELNKSIFDDKTAPTMKKSPSQSDNLIDDIDNMELIEQGYLNEIKTVPKNMIPQTLVRVCFILLRKHLRNDFGFAQYVSDLFLSAKMERQTLLSLLKRETTNFIKIVKEEENPALWGIAFQVYAFLYSSNAISLDDIVNAYLSIPSDAFLLPIPKIIYTMAEITGIPLADVETLPERFNNNSPEFIDSLISICNSHKDLNQKFTTEISAGVFIRCLFDIVLDEEPYNFSAVFDQHKDALLQYSAQYPDMVQRYIDYIIEACELTPEEEAVIRPYFGMNK